MLEKKTAPITNNIDLHKLFAKKHYTASYSYLAGNRVIFITEDITKELSASLSALLLYYNGVSEEDEIKIFINTNGGDANALSNIYDVMQLIKCPISTVCIGKAYSAGSFILAAGTHGRRFITKNASVMIHGLQCLFPAEPAADQKDTEIYFKHLKDRNDNILAILAKHTKNSLKKVLDDCKNDLFFDAKEAIAYGLADKIL